MSTPAAAADAAHGARSVRAKLLAWLLVPLAAVLVAGGIATYTSALNLAGEAYDRSLLDPALAIATRLREGAAGVEVDLPPSALDALRVDSSDRLYFSVSRGGRLLAGHGLLPPPPVPVTSEAPLYYSTVYGDEPVRIAALSVASPNGPVLVQAAETQVKRDRLARQVLLAHAGVELLVLAVAFFAVWFGVGRGLAPIQKLREDIATRSHSDLRPLRERQAPVEVRPLVREINHLLGRLAQSNELQQRFVADAAHQLRTPLAALQAQVEAAGGEALPPRLGKTVEQLQAATRRAAHLVHQLLTLASVDPSAERLYRPQAADLADLVQRELSAWIPQADAGGVDLGFELEPAPVNGEPALLQQLAANLIDNALKYAGRGASVTLRTGQRGGGAYLEVQDNGPGIPEAERERVFERFHRAKGTAVAGAGLGLAIVREIANRHGADIDLATPAGGGTRVTVSFPPCAS
jgi:two-component system sensor histidine kinase TctE